jgi:hypothetical protein
MDHDVFPDTWVATDALGRSLPGFEECGSPRKDRFAGIFYFICNNYDGPTPPQDVTRLLASNPGHPQFRPNFGHWWGEPEAGYYRSCDRWVIRRHAYQLGDAGIDTLIFDVTNDVTYPQTYTAVCEVFHQVRSEGERTPDICFLASEKSALQLWDDFYTKGLFSDLWFRWKGKPLLLNGQHGELRGDMNKVVFPPRMQDFFTIRKSWAWDSLSWYGEGGYHRWPWVAHYPQCIGWDQPGIPEQVPVAVGQHPLSAIGRSFHDGKQPETNEYDVTLYTAQGLHFAEQWRRALEVDPEFIFITGWNEWMAGSVACKDPSQEALQELWSFFPGAKLGRAGKLLKPGDIYFIDQYNQEFSRDAEPMRGGHSDNYYYQMVANIRRYKGVRPLPPVSASQAIDIQGPFSQWDAVSPEYRDHLYETLPRDEAGWGGSGRYTNHTGRNEFVSMKVARDESNLYFYARTRQPITPPTGHNWMLLFLNTDMRKDTGWEGYNYLINWPPLDNRMTTVKKNTGGWSWTDSARARYRVEGDQMMIAVAREALDLAGKPITIDFHWADNIPMLGFIEDFFLHGDSAPARRFDYRYREG